MFKACEQVCNSFYEAPTLFSAFLAFISQSFVVAGRIVLQAAQGLAVDLISLVQVKKTSWCNHIAVYVARRIARHQVRLLSPVTWHGWGRLFIDAYFAAARDATVADARVMMRPWNQAHKELIVFYDETQEAHQLVPVPIADHMEGHGYFPPSGMHWILER